MKTELAKRMIEKVITPIDRGLTRAFRPSQESVNQARRIALAKSLNDVEPQDFEGYIASRLTPLVVAPFPMSPGLMMQVGHLHTISAKEDPTTTLQDMHIKARQTLDRHERAREKLGQ